MRVRFFVGLAVALCIVSSGGCVTTAAPVKPEPATVAPRPVPAPAPPVPPVPPVPPEPASAPEPTPQPPGPVSTLEEGVASFYANRFEGRRTASGERYRKKLATCAHRTHPFGTILFVTAITSGKTASCRVNDRGPYKKARLLDVSRSVAMELDMIGPGVITVRVELDSSPPESEAEPAPPET